LKQQTISKTVELEGRGLFTGQETILRFKPAKPHTGIVFCLKSEHQPLRIPAWIENITKRARRTAIRNGTAAIETIEHCLSACSGMNIDNLEIELTGNEVPGFDGSSASFVDALLKANIQPQDAEREVYVIPEPIRVQDGDSELLALPPLADGSNLLEIHYTLDYGESTPIGHQALAVKITPQSFEKEIAPARTFLLEEEAKYLQSQGMGTHLSYQDLLIFGKDGPIDNELRFPEECVRHKILDLLGDLRLLGQLLVGRVYARKSGHSLNHELVKKLVAHQKIQKLEDRLTGKPVMDLRQIQRILPHRYPFLLVDRVIELEGSKRAVGIKNVTANEEFFQGHYPGQPIMPGVLILDALAQMGGVLMSQKLDLKGRIAVFLSADKVKFRRPVVPGDQLIMEVESIRVKSRTGQLRCKAFVGQELAAEANIKFMMADAEPK